MRRNGDYEPPRRFPALKAGTALLQELREVGLEVTVRGDYLRVDAPEELSPEVEAQLRVHKPALMRAWRPSMRDHGRLRASWSCLRRRRHGRTPERVLGLRLRVPDASARCSPVKARLSSWYMVRSMYDQNRNSNVSQCAALRIRHGRRARQGGRLLSGHLGSVSESSGAHRCLGAGPCHCARKPGLQTSRARSEAPRRCPQ